MKCRFCSGQADTTCQFTLSEPRMGFPPELAVGDLMQSSIDLEYGMVEKLTGPHHDSGMGPYYLATISGKRHKRPQFLNARLPVLVIRHELCGAPVCDCHFINRGDDKAVCAYHWKIEEVKKERAADADTSPPVATPPAKVTPIRQPARARGSESPHAPAGKPRSARPDPLAARPDRFKESGVR